MIYLYDVADHHPLLQEVSQQTTDLASAALHSVTVTESELKAVIGSEVIVILPSELTRMTGERERDWLRRNWAVNGRYEKVGNLYWKVGYAIEYVFQTLF